MFDRLLTWFGIDMGIDLGTSNTLVSVRGEGIVLNEPSVVAVHKNTSKVLDNGNAVGWRAKEMIGKTPGSISAVRPLRDGVISDFEITEAMLSYFIRKVNSSRIMGPRVVIAVPSGITAVEKNAVIDSAERAGARRVYLVPEPMAAALGAGLPVEEARGSMVVDIGGGTTEIAIISLGDIATSDSVRVAGDDMDEAIMSHMRNTYNLTIGEQSSERIKLEIGTATTAAIGSLSSPTIEVRGRDNVSGMPRAVTVTAEEICQALEEPVHQITVAVKRTLERCEPELAADLIESGMVLAGGGGLLRGLDTVLEEATGLKVTLAEDPSTCVARGTAEYLENLEEFKDSMDGSGGA